MDVLSRDAEIINVKEQKRVSFYVVAILVKDPYIDKYFAHSFIHSSVIYVISCSCTVVTCLYYIVRYG